MLYPQHYDSKSFISDRAQFHFGLSSSKVNMLFHDLAGQPDYSLLLEETGFTVLSNLLVPPATLYPHATQLPRF
jgi:hypothetical protein